MQRQPVRGAEQSRLGEDEGTGVDPAKRRAGSVRSLQPLSELFDSATSFGLIRGGHLDVTVLGGLEVDRFGRLANWMVPGCRVPGMGGAMDLVSGATRVIVAMMHTADGHPKIVDTCSLPLTSERRVDLIVTELAVIEPTDAGLVLKELAPDAEIETVVRATGAQLIVPAHVPRMPLPSLLA